MGKVRVSEVRVRFMRNASDKETQHNWTNGEEALLTDVQAIRQVEAGNAVYVTEQGEEAPVEDFTPPAQPEVHPPLETEPNLTEDAKVEDEEDSLY